MLCFRYRKLLIPYNEGSLEQRDREALEAHISRCASCRAELEAVRSMSGVLRSVEIAEVEPVPDLWARVSARIEKEASVRTPRPRLRVTQVTSACTAAALFAVVGLGLIRPDLPAPPAPASLAPAVPAPAAPTGKPRPVAKAVPAPPVNIKASPVETNRAFVRKPENTRDVAAPRAGASTKALKRVAVVPENKSAPTSTRWFYCSESSDKSAPRGREEAAKPAADTRLYASPGSERRKLVAETHSSTESIAALSEMKVTGDRVITGEAATDGSAERGITASAPALGIVSSAGRPEGLADANAAHRDYRYFRSSPAAPAATAPSRAPVAVASAPMNRLAADADRPMDRPGAAVADATYGLAYVGDSAGEANESVVDALNKTEGVHVVALFSYP